MLCLIIRGYQRVKMIGRNGDMNGFMDVSIIVETNWIGYIAIELVINTHQSWEINKKWRYSLLKLAKPTGWVA